MIDRPGRSLAQVERKVSGLGNNCTVQCLCFYQTLLIYMTDSQCESWVSGNQIVTVSPETKLFQTV